MKILYICTHNRCRSILSEAITNQLSGGSLVAKSAGSQPANQVHPLSVQFLSEQGYSTDGLYSQSWDTLADFAPDLVITVCDSAANEPCPVYFSESLVAHWGLEDPSKVEGDPEAQKQAFSTCITIIEKRVKQLQAIALTKPNQTELATALKALGVSL